MSINTKVSYGEFLDKLTILQIKSERISDQHKLNNVKNELEELNATWSTRKASLDQDVDVEIKALKKINEELWEIEDAIREKEKMREFDEAFIQLARAVYVTNDKRAEIKKQINIKLGSALIEEKSYSDYA